MTALSTSAWQLSQEHATKNNIFKTRVHRSLLPGRPWLKLENEQITGSFKARGAINRLHHHSITEAAPDHGKGVTTASTGNHALAVAHAGRVYGIPVRVVLPSTVSETKLEKLKNLGVEIRAHGNDCVEAELEARALAERERGVYVSPYNDAHVIAGQSTIGHELLEQLGSEARTIYITVGGGGLLAGIASVLKPLGWRVVGCQPRESAVMMRCVEAGCVVEVDIGETISDGSAGGVETDCVTLPFCMGLVDAWVVVSEQEIRDGVELMQKEGLVVEGAAGVAVAGYIRDTERVGEGVIVICGGNVSKR